MKVAVMKKIRAG